MRAQRASPIREKIAQKASLQVGLFKIEVFIAHLKTIITI